MSDVAPRPPEPSRDPQLRIGNPERESVVERLNAALNEGRLELAEYDERVRQVYAAKTAGDLVPITSDLPIPAPPPPKRTIRGALAPDEQKWVGVALILLTIWLLQSVVARDVSYFWPAWPIGIWGAVLLGRRITGWR